MPTGTATLMTKQSDATDYMCTPEASLLMIEVTRLGYQLNDNIPLIEIAKLMIV